MLAKVKLAMRITSTALDSEISDNIEACKKDMVRAGVDTLKIVSTDQLVVNAVKLYCLMMFALEKGEVDRYEALSRAYETALENIRRAVDYDGNG